MYIKSNWKDGNLESVEIPRPSDLHAHFRWEGMIDDITPSNIAHYKYVLAMPNNGPDPTRDPKISVIGTLAGARKVYDRIMAIRDTHGIHTFTKPLMTLYHTDAITPKVVEEIAKSDIVYAVKNYPAHGGTTNSGVGVPFDECDEVIREMERCKVRLLLHAEDVHDKHGRELPHEDREAHCIEHRVRRFREKFPRLDLRIEHASTVAAAKLVFEDTSWMTTATVTPQHLLFTKEDFKKYSWRNHLRCMPYVKTEEDRQALLDAVTSGDFRFIAGTDKADHPSKLKDVAFEQAACGCSTPHSVALYLLAFLQRKAVDWRFEQFMSLNGPLAWGLAPPDASDMITIRAANEGEKDIPDPIPLPQRNDVVIPLGWTQEPDRFKVGYITDLHA